MWFQNLLLATNAFYKYASYAFSDMKEDWNLYAEEDPYYYVLRDPKKKGKWKEEDFYNSGIAHVKGVLKYAKEHGLLKEKRVALDFGCGPGRLTEALSKDFDKVIGIDISDKMVDLANERANKKNIENIQYIVSNNLSDIEDDSIDLIITRLTLEHIPPKHIKKYVKDFARILAKGGLASFDIPYKEPEEYTQKRKKIIDKGKEKDIAITLIFSIPKEEISKIISDNGCKVVSSNKGNIAGKDFEAIFYYMTK